MSVNPSPRPSPIQSTPPSSFLSGGLRRTRLLPSTLHTSRTPSLAAAHRQRPLLHPASASLLLSLRPAWSQHGTGAARARVRAGLPWRRAGGQVACAQQATRAATYRGRCAGPAASEAARTGRVGAGRGTRCRPARGRAGAGAAASGRSKAAGLLRRSRGASRPCRRGTRAGSWRSSSSYALELAGSGDRDEDQPAPVTRMEAPPCSSSCE
ncbi:hypothetical protein PVAP13_8KG242101 [Panicum virgatum]|uniref:Uncharacterized protein n=1 Tax=Panicum virgatum TaxID=38727 RepID=A0A8T0PNJ2_PANVG|nr:hypothetical protein PVAP13_8KG242101 [Panicum virgatum]